MENKASLLYQQGLRALNSGDDQKAVTLFRQALSIEADNADILLHLGFALFRSRRFEESAAADSALFDIHPNEIEALKNLGHSLLSIGDIEGGLDKIIKAMSLYPEDQRVYLAMGHAHRDLQQYSEALTMYEKVIAINPTGEAYLNQAVIYRKTGTPVRALEALETAQRLAPYNIYIDLELGHIASDNRDYSEALQYYQRAIDNSSNNSDALFSYGLLCLKTSRNADAASAFKQVLTIHPQHANALYSLGQAEMRLHNYPSAIIALKEAIEVAPQDLEVYQLLFNIQFRTFKWTDACQTIRNAMKNVKM